MLNKAFNFQYAYLAKKNKKENAKNIFPSPQITSPVDEPEFL